MDEARRVWRMLEGLGAFWASRASKRPFFLGGAMSLLFGVVEASLFVSLRFAGGGGEGERMRLLGRNGGMMTVTVALRLEVLRFNASKRGHIKAKERS